MTHRNCRGGEEAAKGLEGATEVAPASTWWLLAPGEQLAGLQYCEQAPQGTMIGLRISNSSQLIYIQSSRKSTLLTTAESEGRHLGDVSSWRWQPPLGLKTCSYSGSVHSMGCTTYSGCVSHRTRGPLFLRFA